MSCLSNIFKSKEKEKRPYKIQDVSGVKKYGIAASSIKEICKKAQARFQIRSPLTIKMEDGSELDEDDFLLTLPSNTLLIVLVPGETWVPSHRFDAKQLQATLHSLIKLTQKQKALHDIEQLCNDEENKPVQAMMSAIMSAADTKINVSNKKEHPEWFEEMPSKFKTKDSVMRDRARARIRKYLYIVKDFSKNQNLHKNKAQFDKVIKAFEKELKNHDYFGDYFDRCSNKKSLRICDNEGWFSCEGLYDRDSCKYSDHLTNPYGNLQLRISFQTWNLDHGIEKTREVLPKLLQAIENRGDREINVHYFFDLMFTRKNLKLVHQACHDKKEHTTMVCDPSKFYVES